MHFLTRLTVSEAKEKLIGFSHSRIPVYHETIDNIDYIVRLKELLLAEQQWLSDTKLRDLTLSDIIKVPLTKPIHLILEQFKKTRSHVALIIDEYWWVAGLVTLEDIVEEVFGDIMDETDKETDAIKKIWWSYVFQSHITMDDFLDKINLSFYELGISEEEFSWEILNYFITSYLERFPKMGEEIVLPITHDEEHHHKRKLNIKILSLKKNVIGEIKAEIVQDKE
jgi:putative hemolysin